MRSATLLLAAALLAPGAAAKPPVKKLLRQFEQGDSAERARLAPALGRTKDYRAATLLLEAFKPREASPKETLAIAEGLGLSGDERALQPLQTAWDYLRSARMGAEELPGHLQVLRWRLLEALGRIGGEEAVAILSEAVNDPDPRVVEEAARGLGRLKVKAAVPALQQLAVKGGNLGQAAIEALAEAGDKRAVSTLEEILKGTDPMVEAQALYALAMLGQRERVQALEKNLKGDNAKLALLSAYYLVKLDRNSGLAHLHALAKKPEEPLAPLAADALGKTGNPRAVLPLVEALKSPDTSVRLMSARSLGRLGGSRAIKALKSLKDDPNVGVRNAALAALDEWGERG